MIADLDAGRAADVARKLCDEGGRATGVSCDVTLAADALRLAELAKDTGRIRAIAHVAGLSPSMADFATIMRVNLAGVANIAKALLPLAGPRTASVLIASLAGHNFKPSLETISCLRAPDAPDLVERVQASLEAGADTPERAYQLSKWAVIDYARQHAHAWGQRGARIVSLSPGLIATPQGSLETEARPSKKRMVDQSPLAREGGMLEIADAVEFLLSEKASFISGIDLLVDGGLAAVLSTTQRQG
jgi:NAD(P)-dependent dehydrogenase (short-subunit alcohol dehydrogenase family)